MPLGIPRVDVLGVGVSAVDMKQALEEITCWVERRERHYVCVTGVHGVMESRRDPSLRRIHNGAAERGWSSYFYGGAPGVAERLAARLAERFGGLAVAGTCSPPFRPLTAAEDDAVVGGIERAAPQLVWVGLGTPKQERWMAAHRDRLSAPVLLGVGAAFDIHAGLLPQAPRWMRACGLEWLYRLGREPRRLAGRYLRNNPRFLLEILLWPPRLQPPLPAPASGPAQTREATNG